MMMTSVTMAVMTLKTVAKFMTETLAELEGLEA